MAKRHNDMETDTKKQASTWAIITAIYDKHEYVSCPIELVDGDDQTQIINDLATHGTNNCDVLKIPFSDEEFMIISRYQLDNTLIKVKIWDEQEA